MTRKMFWQKNIPDKAKGKHTGLELRVCPAGLRTGRKPGWLQGSELEGRGVGGAGYGALGPWSLADHSQQGGGGSPFSFFLSSA